MSNIDAELLPLNLIYGKLELNLILPFTSKSSSGSDKPIPTFPEF